MSAEYQIQTVCECQAILGADLDGDHNVLEGWASRLGGPRETAPANSVAPGSERFDVAWQCPICGRNTLRTFYAGALAKKPPSPDAGPPDAPPDAGDAESSDAEAAEKSA
jgi:hypothetical protein